MAADDFSVPPNATMEEKLDLALFWLATMAKQQAKVDVLEKKVSDLETRVATQEATINTLVKDAKASKEMANSRDQEARSNTLRLFGLPISQDEVAGTKPIVNIVYDRILKPVLLAAKSKGEISSIPHAANLVEECYRAKPASGSSGSDSPPPIIIKLSRAHRLAILRNKRLNTPSPTDAEKAAGIKRFIVVEDLTVATYKMMKELQGDDRVEKVWSVDGHLRLVLNGDDKGVKKVKSVFDSAEHIIQTAKKSK
jgi:outer membrane murein-binding lipoprotein Lpp